MRVVIRHTASKFGSTRSNSLSDIAAHTNRHCNIDLPEQQTDRQINRQAYKRTDRETERVTYRRTVRNANTDGYTRNIDINIHTAVDIE